MTGYRRGAASKLSEVSSDPTSKSRGLLNFNLSLLKTLKNAGVVLIFPPHTSQFDIDTFESKTCDSFRKFAFGVDVLSIPLLNDWAWTVN
jgi:hypothetical protein